VTRCEEHRAKRSVVARATDEQVEEARQAGELLRRVADGRVDLDAAGELTRIEHANTDATWDPLEPWQVAYRRAGSGEVERARRLVRKEFAARIAARVAANAPEERVYYLAILYSESDPGFVPSLGIGTERERVRWIAEHDRRARRELLWNPAEFECFDPEPKELTGDTDFASACQVLAQEWKATRVDAEPRKLLTRVAKELSVCDWGSSLQPG
jgi:hypothetical protein